MLDVLAGYLGSFARHLLGVLLEAAPWLLLGLVAAGLIKVLIPPSWMSRRLGRPGAGSVVRAALIGTPLPLCSCGVLPAAMGLRRHGASRGATVSFLVATPENGADTIALSYALLGPFLAVVRPIASLTSAIGAGLLSEMVPAGWGVKRSETETADAGQARAGGGCCGSGEGSAAIEEEASEPAESAGGCCEGSEASREAPAAVEAAGSCCDAGAGSGGAASEKKAAAAAGGDCCDGGAAEAAPSQSDAGAEASASGRTRDVGRAVAEIYDDLLLWLVIGLVLAAVVRVLLPAGALASWGSGLPAMGLMLLVGVPMYICATASTPLAASLLVAGVSPGTVLVFLLAGPATNMATLAVVRRELGTGTMLAYLGGICGGAVALGLATDAVAGLWSISVDAQVRHAEGLVPGWLAVASAVVMVGLAIRPLRRWLGKAVAGAWGRTFGGVAGAGVAGPARPESQ